ncbi:MAG TPA: HAD family hydrolase [Meiothermus sp.]|nr:HAD family hydrolase [Meiothermus sp.]
MIKLVALDLDGTFYAGPRLGVPESAWAAIERGKREGLRFAVCTGRPQGGYGLEWAKRMEPEGAHVFNDGASICDALGQPLHYEPLPNFAQIVELARKHRITFDVLTETGGRYYEAYLIPPGIEEHVAMVGVPAQSAVLEGLSETVVRSWWVAADPTDWEVAKPDLEAVPDIDIAEYLSPREAIVGIIRKGVSKATGLDWLARHYGLDIGEIAMIGDSDNDVTALRHAGLGIAMGNAVELVKAAADHIVGHVRENGFAEAIEHILECNYATR